MAMLDRGNGLDGDITISSNKNLNTEIVATGRSFADMVSYSVTAIGNNNITTSATPNGIIAGDKVILLNLQGDGSFWTNVGNYEIFEVYSVVSTTITFTTNKTKYYGPGASNDTNIGTGAGNQRVIVQRIPQYNNITISNATVTGDAYNQQKGGVFTLFAKGALTINGTGAINMSYKGYTPPTNLYNGAQGSGPLRQGVEIANNSVARQTPNDPGGGAGAYQNDTAGAGGGYAAVGSNSATRSGYYCYGGPSYGSTDLSKLFMGATGGTAAGYQYGGAGGGIILIHASEINCVNTTSKISANGQNSPNSTGAYGVNQAPGGPAGGSILLHVGAIVATSNNIEALKGLKGLGLNTSTNDGGDGSVGRIAISHPANVTLTGNETSPAPYNDGTLTMPYKISGLSTEPGTMRLYRMDTGAFVMEQEIEAGAYNASIGAPSAGPYLAVAIPTNIAKNATVYRDVTAVEEEV
jgi:hypothetical protein